MAEGYLGDVEIGAHVFVTPGLTRNILRRSPYNAPARQHDAGGGYLTLEATGQRLRASRGDAEWWLYTRLLALAAYSAPCLAYEDSRGYAHVYGDAVLTGASGRVYGGRFAELRLDCQCPEASAASAWVAPPAEPGTYAGRTDAQDYAAGGVSLGYGGELEFRLTRKAECRMIPRARGARSTAPYSDVVLQIVATVWQRGDLEAVTGTVEDLYRDISGRVALTGNGNTYSDCMLQRASCRHADVKTLELKLTFVQDMAALVTTTTTAGP